MHDLDVSLDFVRQQKRVRIRFRLSEDNHTTTFAVDSQDICQCREPVLERTGNGKVCHICRRLVLKLHRQVNNPDALLHVRSSDVPDPAWYGCREE